MYASLNWLKDFVDINVNSQKNNLNKVVVGYVEKVEKHPQADRLNVAEVDVGTEKLQIVCGGINLKKDSYVPVALVGAVLPGNFVIKKTTIRGVESNGMICHLSELGLADDDGKHKISIITKTQPGTPFIKTLQTDGITPDELKNMLTVKTAEVESIRNEGEHLNKVVAGKLIDFEKIPNTKHHHRASVDVGGRVIQLVFGSVHTLEKGWILPIALAGAKLPGGEISETKVRGVLSQGMICEDSELGIQNSQTGLTVFPEGTPLGKPISALLGLNDTIIEFDNKALTHRPDLWGIYGIAREISAIYKTKFKALKSSPKIPTKGEQVKVTVENFTLCPRYCGVIIKNVKIQESPEWIKKRLTAVGHKCYNNIVDVTNFISAELGQPLHAFDKRLIEKGIVVRTAKKGEKITTLDGEERKLTEEMLLIADEKKPLALAGIMGGKNSSIQDDTTEIIIESATFYGGNIRKTSTALGLRTESVQRFEKQLDPNLSLFAMLRAIELILEVSPGSAIAGPITDQRKFDEKLKTVELSIQRACSKIGVEINKKEIKDILKSLHFEIEENEKNKDILNITIPSFRAQKDINSEDDLIEEIARIYGYDAIPAILPNLPTQLPEENPERLTKHELRKLLTLNLGFNEILTYSFYSKTDIEKSGIGEEAHILIENYLSEDQTHMRKSLIPNMLNKVILNTKYLDEFKLFEIGRTYKDIGEYFPLEEKWLTGIITTKDKNAKDKPFYEAKGAVETILAHMKIPFFKLVQGSNLSYAHPTKSATILSQTGETLGTIFTLNPIVAKKYDLNSHVIAAFELNLSSLIKLNKTTPKYKELSRFPSIEFDVSVIIDETTEISTIEESIKKADKHLIQNIKLFDFYKGPNIETNKKAVAFKITLSSLDRTLTDTDMQTIQKKVFENLKSLGGSIRGI